MTGSETVEKLWGSSTSNLYGVGNAGTIVHWDRTNWQKIESVTSLDFNVIWGATDVSTGQLRVMAVASNRYNNQGKRLELISGLTASSLPDSGLSWSLSGIWFDPAKMFYVVGAGIHTKGSFLGSIPWIPSWQRFLLWGMQVESYPRFWRSEEGRTMRTAK